MSCRACPQCSMQKPRAHTSASLIIKSDWADQQKVENHVLFDFGAGTVDSLIDFGIEQVDYLFNTHNHLDHIHDIDRLLNSQRRHQPKDPTTGRPRRIPLHCTNETWKKGIAWCYPWLISMIDFRSINSYLSTATMPGGKKIQPDGGLGIDLKVTPIPVYHGKYAFEPVIFVVEFGRGEQSRKLVLCWDLLHLISQFPLPSGVGLTPSGIYVPQNIATKHGSSEYTSDDQDSPDLAKLADERAKHLDLGSTDLLLEHEILKQPLPEELFLAGNTIKPQPLTGHMSIQAGMILIRRVNPKRTWIVHYSGHEDSFGPLSDDALQDWLDKKKSAYGLSNHEIWVAKHGMVLAFVV